MAPAHGAAEGTAPNPSTAQARTIADELVRGGVRHAVVCPGSRSAALAVALDAHPALAVHIHADERAAAFVALGIGRRSGLPAAVVVTSGTAVANLLPAAVEADLAGVPLLLVTADRPPELRDTGANQTIAQVGLFGPTVRWAVDLAVAEDRDDAVASWRSSVARAVHVAAGRTGAAPGPVHLNVPFREPTVPVGDDGRTRAEPFRSEVDGRLGGAPWVAVQPSPRLPTPDQVDRFADRVADVERGLIIVGAGPGRRVGGSVGGDAVDAVARATGWPVLAEVATDARSAGRTLAAGAWLAADAGFVAAHRPELVLRVGRPTIHTAWGRLLRGSPQLLVDPGGAWHDPTRSLTDLLVADADALLLGLADHLAREVRSAWAEVWRAADERVAGVVTAALTAPGPATGLATARAFAGHAPAGDAVVAASLPVRDLDLAAVRRPDLDVHANRGAAGIDGTVSTALGVALAGGRATSVLLGDQALLHDMGALLLAPDGEHAPPTVVVVDNGGGRLFDLLPPSAHAPGYERLFVNPHRVDLTVLGRLYGRPATRVGSVEGVAEALGGPGAFVVVDVDPAADLALRRRLTAEVAAAIRGTGTA